MNRLTFALCAAASILPACVQTDPNGPPNLRLGRDECAECGMIINEDRCSSALVLDSDGRKEPALFDDIGCMLDFAHDNPDRATPAGFVHDHATRTWVPLTDAWFVLADEEKVKTPMGSGIIAFATRAEAEKVAVAHGASVIDYPGLPPARRAWMEARYGSPDRIPIGADK